MAAMRVSFRGRGLREVQTPTRVEAPAIEPFIEPIAAPPGFLATSPELWMKRLRCHGGGDMFQIAPVFRQGEIGDLHREEFRLLEWYRDGDGIQAITDDVERIVGAVFEAARPWVQRPVQAPERWRRVRFLDWLRDVLGLTLLGNESAADLVEAVGAVQPSLCEGLVDWGTAQPPADVARLHAWTAFFSNVCDQHLDRWLAERAGQGEGVHLEAFPAPLCALARLDGQGLALRVESHVGGRELANGYVELRDDRVQRRRFETVNGLRMLVGSPRLPIDAEFLADLASPGLPPTVGCALGVDRLIMLAVGAETLDAVALAPAGVGGAL